MKKESNKAYGVALYKIENKKIKILLCKSVKSKNKWGFLKGVIQAGETPAQCAKREFFEESSINVNISLFEEYFEQKNNNKDIGVWLVNVKNIRGIDKYFIDDRLLNKYLSLENSKVRYFAFEELPLIKKKQKTLIYKIKDFFNKSQT